MEIEMGEGRAVLDSKEIARRALVRAEEIRAHRRIMTRIWEAVATLFGTGVLVTAALLISPLLHTGMPSILIGDDPIPLASSPIMEPGAIAYMEELESYGITWEIPRIESITIPAGTRQVELTLVNPEGNPYGFIFEIVLKQTGERLYESGVVDPSMSVEKVELARGLAKGEYEVVLVIRALLPEDAEARQVASVDFRLIAV